MLEILHSLGNIGLTILVFLLIFGTLIILHEFGHFWAARAAKVKVLEFGLGLPPKVFSKKTKDGMEWTINALPFGGFVRMLGEEGGSKDPNAFVNRPWGWKILVICGGVIMNFLVGWLLLSGIFWHGVSPSYSTLDEYNQLKKEGYFVEVPNALFVSGNPEILKNANLQNGDILKGFSNREDAKKALEQGNTNLEITRWNRDTKTLESKNIFLTTPLQAEISKVIVENTLPNSLAEGIGLQKGDEILLLGTTPITSTFSISKALKSLPTGTQTSLTLLRNNSETITLSFSVPEKKILGVYSMQNANEQILIMQEDRPFAIKEQSFGIIESLHKGFAASFGIIDMSWKMLQTIAQKISNGGGIPDEMGGPIAIAHTTGQILEFGNIQNLVQFAAMISLSLAFMNILPFPGLDGGRLLFLLIDGIFIVKRKFFEMLGTKNYGGEKIPEDFEGYFHMIGYFLLLGLLVIISWNDIVRIFL